MIFFSYIRSVIWISILSGLYSCAQAPSTVNRGFFYWRTTYQLDSLEAESLGKFRINYQYIRIFDVVALADGTVKPNAIINFKEQLPAGKVIPVVFITPEAMKAIKTREVPEFAKRISVLLADRTQSFKEKIQEIQIDCDWAPSTRSKYFELLQVLKNEPFFKDKLLSATIRLHQIKYSLNTGVPPVDKGLLMTYNMAPLQEWNQENSIINLSVAKQYLEPLAAYPLKLDIGLPIYSWSLLFEKDKSFKGILREANLDHWLEKGIIEPISDDRYSVNIDTFIQGYRLSKGQLIKQEKSKAKTVVALGNLIAEKSKDKPERLILYHLDAKTLQTYRTHELEEIFNSIP